MVKNIWAPWHLNYGILLVAAGIDIQYFDRNSRSKNGFAQIPKREFPQKSVYLFEIRD